MTLSKLPAQSGAMRLSDQLIRTLRERVQTKYYDQLHIIEVIARAILHSRGIYP